MTDIVGMDEAALSAYIRDLGEPAYRGAQLFGWLHEKLVASYDEMTNLPLALRERLKREAPLAVPAVEEVFTSKSDGTQKYLFRLADGQVVESVLMRHSYGLSACLSSQAGCGMGCAFCASAIGGFVRNLSAGELLGQFYGIQRETAKEGDRLSHVVVMGTGEPLLNIEALLSFIRILSSEKGQHLSRRNITVSTCGIVPGIQRLAKEKLPITLALSLHAPTQELREKIMPTAKTYTLKEVMAACADYFKETGRRVTYEYALIAGVNDRKEDGERLAKLLGRGAHVNLIPLNVVEERGYQSPSGEDIKRFAAALNDRGLNATIRRSMGADIEGACGQLRRRYLV